MSEEAAAIDPKAEGIDLTPAAQPAGQQRACAQGLPCRRPGYRDRLQPDRRHPPSPVRHPDRGDGARARRAGRLFEPGRDPARPHPRQGRALHRLGAPAARQAPDRLCDRRRHPSRRAVPARCSSGCSGPAAATGSTRRWSGSPTRPITSTIPALAWKRVKIQSRKPDVLGRLKALAAWRELEARLEEPAARPDHEGRDAGRRRRPSAGEPGGARPGARPLRRPGRATTSARG